MAQRSPKNWATEEKNASMAQRSPKNWATEEKNASMAQREQSIESEIKNSQKMSKKSIMKISSEK